MLPICTVPPPLFGTASTKVVGVTILQSENGAMFFATVLLDGFCACKIELAFSLILTSSLI